MFSYIVRRLILMVPTLLGMSLVVFAVIRTAPGLTTAGGAFGAGGEMKNQQAREAAQQALKRKLRMIDDQGHPISPPMQYLLWLNDTVHGNFGTSVQFEGKPVADLLRERIPVTLSLNLVAAFLTYLVAIPGGMLASVKRGKVFDLFWSFSTLALFSLPIMWVGSMAIGFLCNPRYLGLFPAAGIHSTNTTWMTSFQYAMDYFWHAVLPVLCLSYGGLAYVSKLKRAAMLDNLGLDYVRTARAKGLSELTIVTRHVFRNSLLPMITIFAGIIPGLLGGAIITETIFSIKGMGDLMLNATFSRDLPILQAEAFIGSVISLICLLITDICYAIADPRVSYD
jgi:ABC-type dipeptide/oligopeptide/nickel transport system permease component